jgi:hypothetical protein
VNLHNEPVILSHPDMGDRYFAFELMGITSDNFDYIGQRSTGSEAGHFAIVGPDWSGKLPDGVRRVATAPSPWILILGRTLVDGEGDVPNVQTLQAQYRLTPLSFFDRGGGPVDPALLPASHEVPAPVDPAQDPLGPWKTLNAMLAENPPPAHHAILLKQFAEVGIGPGLDVEAQPEAVKQNLIRAAAVGMPMLKQQMLSGEWVIRHRRWAASATTSSSVPPTSRWRASWPTIPTRRSICSTTTTRTATSCRPAGTRCASVRARCRPSMPSGPCPRMATT